MWNTWWKLCICLYTVFITGRTQDEYEQYTPETTTMSILTDGEKKMSEYILDVLKHFKNPDPVGMLGANIPDPILVPDTRKPIGFTTLVFQNTTVHGISKFRILHVDADISSMKVAANLTIDNLVVKGNCVASSFFSQVQSLFSVKLHGVNVTALASLGISRDGNLTLQDIAMEIAFKTISVNFEDAGAIGFIISSFVNTAGNFLFDSIKPYILKEAYTKATEEINKKLEIMTGDLKFPNTISPLDMVIIDVRKKVRAMNMDPYKLENYNTTVGLFSVGLSNTYITGISSFKRVGNISLTFENNTVIADFEVGTEELKGSTQWKVSAVNGIFSTAGMVSFSVKYINGRIILAQPVDIRKKPKLRELKLDIGNLQIRSDGAGALDYVIESVVNILPNLLRYQIIHVLEGPMKSKIQKELDEFDVEEVLNEELPKMDEFFEKGFKLSELRAINEDEEEDEFFNF